MEVGGGRRVSFGGNLTFGYFGDPLFFVASVDGLFFKDVLDEITTFSVLKIVVAKGRGTFSC